jgi:hypothetical protein
MVAGSRVAAGIPASAAVDSSVLTLTASEVHPATGESVVVTGTVQVLATSGDAVDPCRLHVRVLDASGEGASGSYRVFGTFNGRTATGAGRNATLSMTDTFSFVPSNRAIPGNPVAPLPVRVTVTFDGAGNITTGAATSPSPDRRGRTLLVG